MSRDLRIILIAVPVVAFALLAASWILWPIAPDGPLSSERLPVLAALAFWILVAVAAAASPIHFARGSYVSVAAAPVIAAGILGGPAAAGLVALFGTTELREVRGQVPWYGVVYNHSIAVCAAVVSGVLYKVITNGASVASDAGLLGGVLAGVAFVVVNTVMSSWAVALRERRTHGAVIAGDLRSFGL
ncbi:MAG: hypothetical protein R6W93_10445, partial [Candidatus Limnocylindrales bacterium]